LTVVAPSLHVRPMLTHAPTVKPRLTIRLCQPRGFCAGVDRAIQIVVLALKKYGAPVYVRHEIVHNRYVVEGLQQLGAVFIEELDEIPPEHRDAPVVFSAHGVPKSVPADAVARNLFYLDATCPLVSKVHKQAMRHQRLGRHVLLIGHGGHPEVIGTMGQLPDGAVTLIETEADIERFEPEDPEALGYVTQTTLSVEDTAGLIRALTEKFPALAAPAAESICYATTNRQEAVKSAAPGADLFLVVGAPNSSNSKRLVEVAERAGAKRSLLVQRAADIPWDEIGDIGTLGLSAGASAPEIIVDEIIEAFRERFDVTVDLAVTAVELENFPVMRALRDVELTAADMQFVNGRGRVD
jgi:(E)-4-hydroxy-3-methyl-but-2-enyl pyrophosphate reductase (IPP and DMAPP forming)